MSNTIKHDVLSYNRSTVHIIAAAINTQAKVINCGHFYIDRCDLKEVIIESGTGEQYLIEIPDEFIGVQTSGQFNVIIPLIKIINTLTT